MAVNASREIAWPFHIGPQGGVAFVEDPYLSAVQHLKQLILTNVGERLMRPTYGASVAEYQFENIDDVAASELALRLRAALTDWEPNLVVHKVQPFLDVGEGVMQLSISFTVPPGNAVFTTVVGVGGTMTESTLS